MTNFSTGNNVLSLTDIILYGWVFFIILALFLMLEVSSTLIFLILISISKIISSSLFYAVGIKQNDPSVSCTVAALVFSAIGLTLLPISALSMDDDATNSLAMALSSILTVAIVPLTIVEYATYVTDLDGITIIRVVSILIAVLHLVVILQILMYFFISNKFTVGLAMIPFLIVGVVFFIFQAFELSSDILEFHRFSPMNGSWGFRLGMSTLMEDIVTITFLIDSGVSKIFLSG